MRVLPLMVGGQVTTGIISPRLDSVPSENNQGASKNGLGGQSSLNPKSRLERNKKFVQYIRAQII